MKGHATISQNVSVDINLTVNKFLYGLSSDKKQELTNELFRRGFKAKHDKRSILKYEFNKQDPIDNKHRLTSEDEATVLLIANKIIL